MLILLLVLVLLLLVWNNIVGMCDVCIGGDYFLVRTHVLQRVLWIPWVRSDDRGSILQWVLIMLMLVANGLLWWWVLMKRFKLVVVVRVKVTLFERRIIIL